MKIALVTGASSGLGREFVRQIAEQGKVKEIWAIARRRDRLEALQSISAVPIRVLALDLTRPGDMEYLRNTLQDELPDIRILVNAAGMGRMGPTVDIPAKDNDAMISMWERVKAHGIFSWKLVVFFAIMVAAVFATWGVSVLVRELRGRKRLLVKR